MGRTPDHGAAAPNRQRRGCAESGRPRRACVPHESRRHERVRALRPGAAACATSTPPLVVASKSFLGSSTSCTSSACGVAGTCEWRPGTVDLYVDDDNCQNTGTLILATAGVGSINTSASDSDITICAGHGGGDNNIWRLCQPVVMTL